MKRLTLFFCATFALASLAACQSDDPFGRTNSEIAKEKAACEGEGGEWGPGGLAGAVQCFYFHPDAGKECARSTDCKGACIGDDGAPGGTCASVSPLFGCFPFIDETGQRAEICVD